MKKHWLLPLALIFSSPTFADSNQEPIYTNKHRVKSISKVNVRNFNARFYDGFAGKFISPDPIQHANWYMYARNNPVTYIDMTGMSDTTPPAQIKFTRWQTSYELWKARREEHTQKDRYSITDPKTGEEYYLSSFTIARSEHPIGTETPAEANQKRSLASYNSSILYHEDNAKDNLAELYSKEYKDLTPEQREWFRQNIAEDYPGITPNNVYQFPQCKDEPKSTPVTMDQPDNEAQQDDDDHYHPPPIPTIPISMPGGLLPPLPFIILLTPPLKQLLGHNPNDT